MQVKSLQWQVETFFLWLWVRSKADHPCISTLRTGKLRTRLWITAFEQPIFFLHQQWCGTTLKGLKISTHMTCILCQLGPWDIINIPIIPNSQAAWYSACDVTALPLASELTSFLASRLIRSCAQTYIIVNAHVPHVQHHASAVYIMLSFTLLRPLRGCKVGPFTALFTTLYSMYAGM